jgi:toxin ParE1/3/4
LRKYKIDWSAGSQFNLEEIEEYIARENPQAAAKTVLAIIDHAEAVLSLFPSGGRAGRVDGTREFVLTDLPYIVIYTTHRFTVYIVRVFHTSQDFQRIKSNLE